MNVETTIPFGGFYESIHRHAIDQRYEDDHGELTDAAVEELMKNAKEDEIEYCREYVCNFSGLIGIPLTFVEMTSPREYNFMTDRIFAKISEEDVEKMKAAVDPVLIRAYVKKHYTSRDGFSSFYDNEYDNWLKQDKPFDHNQIGALIEVYALWIDPDWEEEVYEDTQGNF